MKRFIILALIFLGVVGHMECVALEGDWRGELKIGAAKLPLVFHFSNAENELKQCTVDSPMQGVKGLSSEIVFCNADSVSLKISSIGAEYAGKISDQKITGIFTQRGISLPLILSPEAPVEERRPQTPRGPFPYATIDTTFSSADGTILAGTLTLPSSKSGNGTAVVLVTGSGPQNRDEEMFDHKPFAVIADYLARQGIASLRYDDRGVAKSGGDFKSADIDTFKSDAKAAEKFLRGLKGVKKTGIIGHSEGGTIALMLAADQEADFTISLAGAIVPGKDIILAQNLHYLNQLPISQKQKDDGMTLVSRVFDDIISGKSSKEIDVEKYVSSENLDIPPAVMASFRQNIASMTGSYYRQLISMNPSEWLGKIKIPVFALNGAADTQVLSKDNLAALSKVLPEAKVKEYPALNHLFQHAVTGEITEYAEIKETISPEVLDDIIQFILSIR